MFCNSIVPTQYGDVLIGFLTSWKIEVSLLLCLELLFSSVFFHPAILYYIVLFLCAFVYILYFILSEPTTTIKYY